jgi:hypothetical protein
MAQFFDPATYRRAIAVDSAPPVHDLQCDGRRDLFTPVRDVLREPLRATPTREQDDLALLRAERP